MKHNIKTGLSSTVPAYIQKITEKRPSLMMMVRQIIPMPKKGKGDIHLFELEIKSCSSS